MKDMQGNQTLDILNMASLKLLLLVRIHPGFLFVIELPYTMLAVPDQLRTHTNIMQTWHGRLQSVLTYSLRTKLLSL